MTTQPNQNDRARIRIRLGSNEFEVEGPVDFVQPLSEQIIPAMRRMNTRRYIPLQPSSQLKLIEDNIADANEARQAGDTFTSLVEPASQLLSEQPPKGMYVPPESFRDWAAHYDLTNNNTRTLAIVAYLCQKHHEAGTPVAVNSSDIAAMFKIARWEMQGTTVSTALNRCAKSGWVVAAEDLEPSGRQGLWRISKPGQSHLETLKKKEPTK